MTILEALGICLGWEQLIYFIRPLAAARGLSHIVPHKSHMVGFISQWPERGFVGKDKLFMRRAAALLYLTSVLCEHQHEGQCLLLNIRESGDVSPLQAHEGL